MFLQIRVLYLSKQFANSQLLRFVKTKSRENG